MSNHAPKANPAAKLLFVGSLLAIVAVVYILLSNTSQRDSTKGEVDKSEGVRDVANNLQPVGSSPTSDAPAVAVAAAPEATTPPIVEAAASVAAAAVVEKEPVVEAPAVAGGASLKEGKAVYDKACFTCHKTGVAGSPITGNKEAWASRIATGIEALYSTALKGKGAMPPKGGNMSLEDDAVKAAVDYMVSELK